MSAKIVADDFGQSEDRGHSSAGRAPGLQPGGRRFDPGWLHQLPPARREARDDASSCEPTLKAQTCAGVIARLVVWSADAAKRSACSLTIRKVFVLTLSFKRKCFFELK